MKGFSLIEVIIGLGLLLVTLIIFAVAISTVPLTRTARNQNLAYHLAAKKMEELRNTPYASLPAGGSFTDPGLLSLPMPSASLAVSSYQGSADIKTVTVTVAWNEAGAGRNVELWTLMSKTGLSKP